MTDGEYDAIFEQGADAAIHAWGPLGSPKHPPCPYPQESKKADVWWRGFNDTYARENGY